MTDGPMSIEFWFDPGCPFTWRTSRWLTDVAARREMSVTWRLMSLAVLNEGKEIPEQFRARIAQGTRTLRVLAACDEAGGQEALRRLYSALGSRVHEQGAPDDDDALRAAIAEAGLDESLAAAADDARYDDRIRASHAAGQRRVGIEAGSPVTAIGDAAFHGPVVSPVPTGEEAMRLFDAVRLLAAVPSFSELKTARAPF